MVAEGIRRMIRLPTVALKRVKSNGAPVPCCYVDPVTVLKYKKHETSICSFGKGNKAQDVGVFVGAWYVSYLFVFFGPGGGSGVGGGSLFGRRVVGWEGGSKGGRVGPMFCLTSRG